MYDFDPPIHGFIVADPARVRRKLEHLRQAGPTQLHLLSDFDHTLTAYRAGGLNTSWQAMHDSLPLAAKSISEDMRTQYLPFYRTGSALSPQIDHTFSTGVLNLHANHGTHRDEIKAAAERIILRRGCRTLFKSCTTAGIPTIILSAGIHEVIDVVMQKHKLSPSLLVSIQLQFGEDGRVQAWNEDTLVLASTKNTCGSERARHITAERPNVLLLGDSLNDPHMAAGEDSVLRIRVCDVPASQLLPTATFYQQSFAAGYDMLLPRTLTPAARLAQWITFI